MFVTHESVETQSALVLKPIKAQNNLTTYKAINTKFLCALLCVLCKYPMTKPFVSNGYSKLCMGQKQRFIFVKGRQACID